MLWTEGHLRFIVGVLERPVQRAMNSYNFTIQRRSEVLRSGRTSRAIRLLLTSSLFICSSISAFALNCGPDEEEIDGRCVHHRFDHPGYYHAGAHRTGATDTAARASAGVVPADAAAPAPHVHPPPHAHHLTPAKPSQVPITAEYSTVVDSGYAFLLTAGSEKVGFGLYTYALLTTSDVARSKAMIQAILASTQAIGDFDIDKHHLNVIYIPSEKLSTAASEAGSSAAVPSYNYKLSRSLLDRICVSSIAKSNNICHGDLSVGPYLFTYAAPLGNSAEIAPPLLFVDLSGINPRAFSTYVEMYKEQVKQADITDMAKINTLKMNILSITLDAADILPGFPKAYGDSYIHELAK